MDQLDLTIKELYEREPYWNMCNPCQCGGYCCIGADISISEDEWHKIKQYIGELSQEDMSILANNIDTNKMCFFRTPDKCMIHAVRPENCKYTPYQYLVTQDNRLQYHYAKVNDATNQCEFKFVDIPLADHLLSVLKSCKFHQLPNYDKQIFYLNLNWQVAHSQPKGVSHHLSEWLQIESLIR